MKAILSRIPPPMFGSRKPVADLVPTEQVLLDLGGDRASDFVPVRVHAVDASRIRLEAPRRAEDAVMFRPGIAIHVRFLRGSEMGIFKTAIEDMETASDGRKILVASQPDRVRWTQDIPDPQKRQFSRLDVDLEIGYAIDEGEIGTARAVELSGGGLILDLPRPWEAGVRIVLDFAVGTHPIHTPATVVRCRPGPVEGRFQVALHFVRIDPTDEDAIAHFIFEAQRSERRRDRS